MTTLLVSHPTGMCKADIVLPASKSISNRALVLNKLCGGLVDLHNLSTADDTVLMTEALSSNSGSCDVKNAGTCMRFLTAYFACMPGSDKQLLCSPRMEQRPIATLVEALRTLGADITYQGREGFPPLHIRGQKLKGGALSMDASVSSQFISALMMVGPFCSGPLELRLQGEPVSRPYVNMTASVMQALGLQVSTAGNTITIQPQQASSTNTSFTIEADWSSASYWYEIAALSRGAEIVLPGLSLQSIQGDRRIVELMRASGVLTQPVENGIVLSKGAPGKLPSTIDLKDCPDLAPALVVTAAAAGAPVTFTGLAHLAVKESDRLAVLREGLAQCGFLAATGNESLSLNGTARSWPSDPPLIRTHNDHRMAMAFAPLALKGPIRIQDAGCVVKSYPRFWEHLRAAGFTLQ